tara:strand:+ start:474 stop:1229 length:756 start_codon:yes stop_codon:yes gene_type:complete
MRSKHGHQKRRLKLQAIPKVDPLSITNFERNRIEQELFLLFCIFVAGRASLPIADKLNRMFSLNDLCMPAKLPDDCTQEMRYSAAVVRTSLTSNMRPFSILRKLYDEGLLMHFLQLHKLGQYTRIYNCIEEITNPATGITILSDVSVDALVSYSGIGPKTARFFVVHSRPNQKYAILDTHILNMISRYLSENCGRVSSPYRELVPKSTPQNETEYKFWELMYLGICSKQHKEPAEFDLATWLAKGGVAELN